MYALLVSTARKLFTEEVSFKIYDAAILNCTVPKFTRVCQSHLQTRIPLIIYVQKTGTYIIKLMIKKFYILFFFSEVEHLESSELCKICMDAPMECVLLECGHIATCIQCGKQLSECPICRQYVIRIVRTFKA